MEPFYFIARWFWVAMIFGTILNLVIIRFRPPLQAKGDPKKLAVYTRILNIYYIGSIIPYLVMGFGILVGGVPTVFHFFRPQDKDPYVLAFFATIFVLWLLCFYWIFFRDGAQTLADHPGIVTKTENPLLIKLMMVIVLAASIASLFIMYQMDIPIDEILGL